MQTVINAKTLRAELGTILQRVRRGERFTVVYRSRPVCQLTPVDAPELAPGDLTKDPLFRAEAVGHSTDGKASTAHDEVLYGDSR